MTRKIYALKLLASIAFVLTINSVGYSQPLKDFGDIEKGFINPPSEAKPRVWWHWMNGNVTKDGIKKDLEWMKRVGIGGFQNFDAGLTTPKVVDKRLIYMTPEWKDAFHYATKLADSLGLELGIAGSPGWSESGGPWVKPEEAMKKYVWSEIRITGGKTFKGTLPALPSVTGQFQNIGPVRHGEESSNEKATLQYCADSKVIAFRVSENEKSLSELNPKITSSGGNFNLNDLTDGNLINSSALAESNGKAWIQYEFENPVEIQALTIVSSGGAGRSIGPGAGTSEMTSSRMLSSSDDGVNFKKVIDIPDGGAPQKTVAFSPLKARYFRVVYAPKSNNVQIAEFVLSTGARVTQFEEKSGFVAATNLEKAITPDQKGAIKKGDIVDLTSFLGKDGQIEWNAPEGNWIILRIGCSLIGRQNGPASPEATGLEVDKMSAKYVRNYFTNYLDQYEDATGGLMGKKGLQFMITDSWEAGSQNWTDEMFSEFKKRRGYDMIPWTPVLSGYVVESAEASDKFLWDFRRTIEELIAQNHYDLLTKLLAERGMGRYSEAHEAGRALVADGMEIKKTAAVPMAALWTPSPTMFGENVANFNIVDIKESASVSHIYGNKYVAAESLTALSGAWGYSPDYLKTITDMGIASGLNRFLIHCSVHQPVDDKIPGLSLGQFGQWFTRHETWAEQAKAWMDYLSRSCYMMQQGKAVADVIYFYGEDDNITAMYVMNLPAVPEGYDYDFTNADALVNALSVKDGAITTPTGMKYKILALDKNCERMTLPVLKKIEKMVNAGALVVGNKPKMSPSLSDDPKEFKAITDKLWGNENGVNNIGKGTVYGGKTIADVLNARKIAPDFSYTNSSKDAKVLYVHHALASGEIYWLNNRNKNSEDIEATFRVKDLVPEIWFPETGRIEKPSYSIKDGFTKVKIHLESEDAKFVVFRNKAETDSYEAPKVITKNTITLSAPWIVNFQENRGAPAQLEMNSLLPWNESNIEGVKYFSGIGTYTKNVQLTTDWLQKGFEIWIDLGDVKSMAEVVVNGKSAGIAWKKPFQLDISKYAVAGDNKIEIKVVNLWVNRLIGDQQPDAKVKYTYTTMPVYNANSPLKPSGLMGPVRLFQRSN